MVTDNANKKERANFVFFDEFIPEMINGASKMEASTKEAVKIIRSTVKVAAKVFNKEHKESKIMDEMSAAFEDTANTIDDFASRFFEDFRTVIQEASNEYDNAHSKPSTPPSPEPAATTADVLVNGPLSTNGVPNIVDHH